MYIVDWAVNLSFTKLLAGRAAWAMPPLHALPMRSHSMQSPSTRTLLLNFVLHNFSNCACIAWLMFSRRTVGAHQSLSNSGLPTGCGTPRTKRPAVLVLSALRSNVDRGSSGSRLELPVQPRHHASERIRDGLGRGRLGEDRLLVVAEEKTDALPH